MTTIPKTTRWNLLSAACACALLHPIVIEPAKAQSRAPIKIIIPFAAGGPTDGITRSIQAGLQSRFGMTVLVENRTGGTGSVGASAVAKSPPDGSTWLLTSESLVLNPLLLKAAGFDARRDLEPVTIIGRGPSVLNTTVAGPYKTLEDLVAAAKTAPNTISYGSSGTGGNSHLTTLLVAQKTGMKLVHVPYRGLGPALNDAVAGHVKLVTASTASAVPLIHGGQLRGLVQLGATRAPSLPDIPTMIESGYPETQSYAWYGVLAPLATPTAIIDGFVADVRTVLGEPAVARQFAEAYRLEMSLKGPADMRDAMNELFRVWEPIIADNNIKVEN